MKIRLITTKARYARIRTLILLITLLSSFVLHPSSLAHAQAAAVLTTLHSFGAVTNSSGDALDGANPTAGLVQGSDGYFYGTTHVGGRYGECGTVFKITSNGYLTTLYAFGSITNVYGVSLDGAGPNGLVQGSDGNFYGTTFFSQGSVFRITPSGDLTNLYSFIGGSNGDYPSAGLVQGSDGYLYGTTSDERSGFGTVFQISTNGVLTNLYSFTGGNDGANPFAGLVQGSDGYLYGTTWDDSGASIDGEFGPGTVFQISTNGALRTLYAFGMVTNANNDALDGANPAAGLVQGSDGNFYGTTYGGGTNDFGTVFEISTNGVLTNLHSFTGGNDGANPEAGLMQGSDGYFYGMTEYGGTYSNGTVFQISTNGDLTTLYSFTGGDDGWSPLAGLVQANDGSLYGTTEIGGLYGYGTVFRLTIVPEFQAATLTNNSLSLAWSTEAGGTYQLQYTSDLTSTNWINLNNPVTATGATLSTTDSLTNAPQRFYRLVLSP
jgi:uncharacterized repeat protein (TIGR03803 family)